MHLPYVDITVAIVVDIATGVGGCFAVADFDAVAVAIVVAIAIAIAIAFAVAVAVIVPFAVCCVLQRVLQSSDRKLESEWRKIRSSNSDLLYTSRRK